MQIGKGRPSENTKYCKVIETNFALTWGRNKDDLKLQNRIDGVFSLLSTDSSRSSVDVLKAYKHQPRLEKRFEQLKQVHRIAPLLFKKLSVLREICSPFFVGLLIQTLLERKVQKNIKSNDLEKMYIYPEQRE